MEIMILYVRKITEKNTWPKLTLPPQKSFWHKRYSFSLYAPFISMQDDEFKSSTKNNNLN